jgi:hypothetical protein
MCMLWHAVALALGKLTHSATGGQRTHPEIIMSGRITSLRSNEPMIFLVPVLYLAVFTVLLGIVWSRLDDKSVIAITSVLAGGLAGLIGAFLSSVISHRRSEQESEDCLKQYASTQAFALTKLEFAFVSRRNGRTSSWSPRRSIENSTKHCSSCTRRGPGPRTSRNWGCSTFCSMRTSSDQIRLTSRLIRRVPEADNSSLAFAA